MYRLSASTRRVSRRGTPSTDRAFKRAGSWVASERTHELAGSVEPRRAEHQAPAVRRNGGERRRLALEPLDIETHGVGRDDGYGPWPEDRADDDGGADCANRSRWPQPTSLSQCRAHARHPPPRTGRLNEACNRRCTIADIAQALRGILRSRRSIEGCTPLGQGRSSSASLRMSDVTPLGRARRNSHQSGSCSMTCTSTCASDLPRRTTACP